MTGQKPQICHFGNVKFFPVFYIACILFLYCFVYVYLFLFVANERTTVKE